MVWQLPHQEDQSQGREEEVTEVTSLRVYMRHLRAAKLCAPGAKAWWASHGLDFRDFVRNGIDAQTLIETGDPDALRVVEIARTEDVS